MGLKKNIVLQKTHIMKLKAGVLGARHLGKIHLKLLQQSEF